MSRVHAVLERAGGHWTLVDDGLSRKEIADAPFISVETVKSHLRVMFDRFGVGADVPQNRKRAELARRAIERGSVPR